MTLDARLETSDVPRAVVCQIGFCTMTSWPQVNLAPLQNALARGWRSIGSIAKDPPVETDAKHACSAEQVPR